MPPQPFSRIFGTRIMQVFWSIDDAEASLKDGALAIGNFDGVHLGHQALIKKAQSLSPRCFGVLSFSPHPQQLIRKDRAFYSLMTDQEKIETLARYGVQVAIIHKIDEDFLTISAEDFIKNILVKRLGVKHVVTGEDFTFGHKAKGTTKLLADLGQKLSLTTHVIADVMINGQRCSSTAIRDHLRHGRLLDASAMLGRDVCVSGVVVHGQKQGAKLGFKTANLLPQPGFVLANGIYASITRVQGKDYLSATNVGTRPTVTEDKTVVVETHILEEDFDLYGQTIRIFFIEALRPEKKFSSLKELEEHIARDCAQTRALYLNNPTRFHVKD